MSYSLLFFGTPDFAVPFLDSLHSHTDFSVNAIITQPDKPAGRSGTPVASPVAKRGETLSIPVYKFESLKEQSAQKTISELSADCFVVVAYGNILPASILDLSPKDAINVHFSLLPKYRGASPVEQALLDGQSETGISIMLMEEGLDTGAVLSSTIVPIDPKDTTPILREKLVTHGCKALTDTITKWLTEEIKPIPQDDSLATTTGLIRKQDGRIQWDSQDADLIVRMNHAYTPWPGTYTTWNDKILKIITCKSVSVPAGKPGEVTKTDNNIYVGTPSGALQLETIQLEGKKPVPVQEFIQGYKQFIGSVLGE